MSGLYSLRRADFSVRLAVLLFMGVLGYSYVFAFLMVRDWAGLTPERVSATYAPAPAVDEASLPSASESATEPLDLGTMDHEVHHVDTALLIQDSHIHIMMYAIVAALLTLVVLGLEWGPALRNTVIATAFGAGALDFTGQWLVKFGISGFSYLTIASGWLMAAVYVGVLGGVVRALAGGGSPSATSTTTSSTS